MVASAGTTVHASLISLKVTDKSAQQNAVVKIIPDDEASLPEIWPARRFTSLTASAGLKLVASRPGGEAPAQSYAPAIPWAFGHVSGSNVGLIIAATFLYFN